MPLPFKQYVPQDVSELYDMMAMMVMASPTFKSDYFAEQTLETVFAAFVEGLAVAADELGAQRYQSLIELTAKARALFESDPWEKTGAAREGQRILWDMEDLLREGGKPVHT